MTASTARFLEVTEAKYVSGYKLLLTFNDGEVRVVDFGPFLAKARNPDTTDYRDLKKFKDFHIQEGDLVWGDYQMVFPIMDLYRGNVLKGEEELSSHYQLHEVGPPLKSFTFKYPGLTFGKKTKLHPKVSYKKFSSVSKKMKIATTLLKHKKSMPHV